MSFLVRMTCSALRLPGAPIFAGVLFLPTGLWAVGYAIGLRASDLADALSWARNRQANAAPPAKARRAAVKAPPRPRPAPEPED